MEGIYILIGFLVKQVLFTLTSSQFFITCLSNIIVFLLILGLYSNTYFLQIETLKKHLKAILLILTIGILLKSLIAGGLVYLISRNIWFIAFAVALSQIDPLSVSVETRGTKKSWPHELLRIWSSFDDPMSVLILIYLVIPFITHTDFHLMDYVMYLFINIGVVFVLLFLFFRGQVKKKVKYMKISKLLTFLILIVFSVFNLPLAGALLGLWVRPFRKKEIHKISQFAYHVALFLLGFFMQFSNLIYWGIVLGILVFITQIFVGWLFSPLYKTHKVLLMFGQQQGTTAIFLALFLNTYNATAGAIMLAGILTINILHWLSKQFLLQNYLTV